MTSLLRVLDATKHYGGAAALDGCTLDFAQGEITGLIGPNGAGKTTLVNVIAGLDRLDSGSIYFDDAEITRLAAYRIARRGLVRTFQLTRDLGSLTVLENMLLAPPAQPGETLRGAAMLRAQTRRRDIENAERARALLAEVGLWKLADLPAGRLSGGQKKLLELSRTMMLDPRMIILDEPAAGVSPPLLEQIVELIERLKGTGVSFVIIEHDMRLIGQLCDHVHVLAEGRSLISGSFAEVTGDHRVVEAYLGMAL